MTTNNDEFSVIDELTKLIVENIKKETVESWYRLSRNEIRAKIGQKNDQPKA